ncbi:hypothetical protein NQ318_011934 [Aromia moschata]|uniref:Major facilitator superfamily (MFS) profile domain-containing protein n=1 Tax=Aromia moschata TaxID=1265417 RepID=A0AAV8XJB5_9CUCU|nr:hypothetical protein NQ318_011934 [Aromia moschata]
MLFTIYPKKPNHAPSQAQLQERINNQKITTSVFTESLKKLIKNKAFVIHVIAYGACFGVSSSSAVVLSQFNISHRDAHNEASRMGLPMTLIGMVGSILIGLILDQTHKYKETVFAVCLLSTLSTVWLLFALEYQSKWMIYFTIGAFSFFVNAYWPAGIEFAMEITFPSSESTTTGILLAVSRISELIFTLILSVINFKYGAVWAVAAQVVILLTATLLTYWTPNNLRRQEAFRKNVEFEKVPQEDEIFNN